MVYLCKPDIEVVKVLYCVRFENDIVSRLHGKTRIRSPNNKHQFCWASVLQYKNKDFEKKYIVLL